MTLLMGLISLNAQEAAQNQTTFTVVALTKDGVSDAAFASLIASFIITEIKSENFISQSLEVEPEDVSLKDSIPNLVNTLPAETAGYLIAVIFTRTNESVLLDFYCIDVTDAAVVYADKKIESKLLLIDVELARLTAAVLDTLGDSLARAEEEPEQPETDGSNEIEPVAVDAQAVEAIEQETVASDVALLPESLPREEPSWSLRPEQSRVQFAIGAGSLRTIAYAEDFFRSATFPTATIDYGLSTRFGRIGFGARIAAGLFSIDGEEIDASGILAPFATNVSYTSATESIVDFISTLGGGGSLLLVRIGDEAYQAKLMPFVSSGVGALLRLTSSIGIRAMVEVVLFFEDQHPIIGYVPSVSIVF